MTITAERPSASLRYARLADEWLAEDIDAWTKRVVRRHFDPEQGTPTGSSGQRSSRSTCDITRYEELVQFGPFPLDVLREADPTTLVPKRVPRPLTGRIWEFGGTTGTPCGLSYGNTFGNAASLPAESDCDLLPYVPNYPQVTTAGGR